MISHSRKLKPRCISPKLSPYAVLMPECPRQPVRIRSIGYLISDSTERIPDHQLFQIYPIIFQSVFQGRFHQGRSGYSSENKPFCAFCDFFENFFQKSSSSVPSAIFWTGSSAETSITSAYLARSSSADFPSRTD